MLKRIFIGVPVTQKLQDDIEFGMHPLRVLHPEWRWVEKKNYHVTVSFFGEIEEEKIEMIKKVVGNVCSVTPAFTLTFKHLTFAPNTSPRMLWAKADKSSPFNTLTQLTESRVSGMIELPDYRKSQVPMPHITIARFDPKEHRVKNLPLLSVSLPVERLSLFESDGNPLGSHYTQVADFILPPQSK